MLLNARFIIFLLGIVMARGGWFMSLPFMAIYLSHRFHSSPVEIGIVLGAGPLAGCFAGILGGILADKYGNRAVMLSALLLSALIFLLFSISSSVIAFGVLNLFLGIFRAFFDTAGKSYLMDLMPLPYRARALGLRYAAINVAASIAPPIAVGLFLASTSLIFTVAALAYAATFAAYFISIKNFPRKNVLLSYWQSVGQSYAVIARDKVILGVIFSGIIIFFAFAQIDSTLPQVMATRMAHYLHVYSRLLIINAATVVLLQVPLDLLVQRYQVRRVIYVAVAFYATAFIVLAFAYSAYAFALAVFLLSVGEIANVSVNNALLDKFSSPHMKGAYFGAANLSMLGFSLGPFLGGIILQYTNGAILYLFTAGLAALCLLFYSWCYSAR